MALKQVIELGRDIEAAVGRLLGDRFVQGRLKAGDVKDKIGLADGDHVLGSELEIVGLCTRGREVGDLDRSTTHLLGRVLKRVEGGDNLERLGRRTGLCRRGGRR